MTFVRYARSFPARDAREFARIPHVDVLEQPGRYVLRADLPGVAPADIEITTHDGVLTLRAERRADPTLADAEIVGRPERYTGTFLRRFTLPEDADTDAISARSAHGVLELTIAKQARSQPRRIEIQAA